MIQLFTAATGILGGALLVIEPDGHILAVDPALLSSTPFSDWFWPGMLLGVLVGAGFLLAAFWQWQHGWMASWVSVAAGIGLIAFELVEFALIGFHPLQPSYAVIGAAVIVLALQVRRELGRR